MKKFLASIMAALVLLSAVPAAAGSWQYNNGGYPYGRDYRYNGPPYHNHRGVNPGALIGGAILGGILGGAIANSQRPRCDILYERIYDPGVQQYVFLPREVCQ